MVNEYLSKYEIHLENAMTQLSKVQHLSPYIQINPYKELLAKVNEFAGLLKNPGEIPLQDISLENIQPLVQSLDEKLSKINKRCEELSEQRLSLQEDLKKIKPFLTLPEDVDKLIHYRFVQAVSDGYRWNITKNSKNMCMITWIPCSIPATRMIMCGGFILSCGQKWNRWMLYSLPCILRECI